PKPYSKETAALMMADSVEAASRSLADISEEKINNLVDSIIDNQMQNGQFDNANITFKDIATIKGIFKQKLVNIYHARIEYPDEKQK
ncbi:MAG TPA: hydrolase, partial [Bacteroidales bacterium]|nr:hydrolase [Bacteroidales bacterium]